MMNVTLEARHVALPRHAGPSIVTRVRTVLSRFAGKVARLDVTLKDINGPRGGRDKVCVLRAELADGGQVVVVDRDTRLRVALNGCLRRSRQLLSRELRRRRGRSRRQRVRAFAEQTA